MLFKVLGVVFIVTKNWWSGFMAPSTCIQQVAEETSGRQHKQIRPLLGFLMGIAKNVKCHVLAREGGQKEKS